MSLLPTPSLGVVCGLAGLVAATLHLPSSQRSKLNGIPTVGSSSLWAGFKYHINAARLMQEGREKYKSSPFKLACMYRWMIILSNQEQVEELLRASDDDLSPAEATKEMLLMEYMLPKEFFTNEYHFPVIRSQFARNAGTLCPAIRDEIVTAFDEGLDLKGNEWKSMPALGTVQRVVCRASNRLFVGLPLCRDPDWVDLNIKFTIDFATAGARIGLFPSFIKARAASFFLGSVNRGIARGAKLLGPIVEERLGYLRDQEREDAESPGDLLSWFIEGAKDAPLTAESLATRILTSNFAGVHSTSDTFTHALFYLAENPQYILPLREEVEAIVEKEGWTKVALAGMHKVDSFLKESRRLGMSFMSLARIVMRDYTFADGTFLPKGTMVGIGSRAVHYDDRLYENASTFEPFRFVGVDQDEGAKHQFFSAGIDYLSFGYGKHACPGRFLIANELKLLMAHVVVTYDVKLDDTTTPRYSYIGVNVVPNPDVHVQFRKRVN